MAHLVWWIGSQEEMGTYSVVAQQAFLPYEEGVQKNMHEIPKKLKRMIDLRKKLSKSQQEEIEGLTLLNELAMQAPEDREHPRGDFTEEEFWGYGDGDDEGDKGNLADDGEDDELLDDEDDLLDSPSEAEPVKKKKRKYNKRKKALDLDEEEEIIYDDIEEVPPVLPKKEKKTKTKLKRGRGPGRPRKKRPEDERKEESTTVDMEVDLPVEEPSKQIMAAPAPAPAPVEAPAPAPDPIPVAKVNSLDELIGEDEASVASADSALVDSDYGGEDDDIDDNPAKDLDLVASTSVKKLKKLKKKGSKNLDKAGKDENGENGEKRQKKKLKKEKADKEPKKRTKSAEQRDLEKCEEEFLPLIEKLRVAKDKKDVPSIQRMLETLLPVAESFAASFFGEYEIPKLMKSTKTVLEDSVNGDTSTYRKLWNKMKASYTEKAKYLPEGFKAKKRKAKAAPKESTVKVEEEPVRSNPEKDESNTAVQADQIMVKVENESAEKAVNGNKDGNMPSPSHLKVPTKEGKRRPSVSSDQGTKPFDKPPAKPKPKKFSVMDFMRQKKETPRDTSSSGVCPDRVSSISSRGPDRKTVPSWVTAPPPSKFDSFAGSTRREDRLFALQFLLQAAAHFPSGKGVNEESVARALEAAIYEWSENQNPLNWADTYWDKVHAVVAAITGKREIGTLVSMILDGHFSSPKSIVSLSDDNLEHSFEGRPVTLSGE
jgi:hypothetical protein